MNNVFIISQDKKVSAFCRCYGVGRREPKKIIGDELKTLMDKKGISVSEMSEKIGKAYRFNLERILNNEEIPNSKTLVKITQVLDVSEDYFDDKELENVIVVDNGIIVAKYETNDRAIEVKNQIDEMVLELYNSGKPIVIKMPS